MTSLCPLCASDGIRDKSRVRDRLYLECAVCGLVFLTPEQHPSEAEGRSRYLHHRNAPDNAGYVRLLSECIEPVANQVREGVHCLDYGSGPEPVLCCLLREAGVAATAYDPLFAPDDSALCRSYDVVFCVETAEHFRSPGDEFSKLDSLLKPGGWLVLRTMLLRPDVDFETWWYARDLTHICFYRSETIQWIARRYGWTVEEPSGDVFVFHKQ